MWLAKDLYYSTGFIRTIFTACLLNDLICKLLKSENTVHFCCAVYTQEDGFSGKKFPDIYYFWKNLCSVTTLTSVFHLELVGFGVFHVRKAIQHSFHSKPKNYDALPHLYFERKGTECDSRVFLLWCRDTDLEAALNIQHAQPYLTYGVKNKLPS